MNFLSGVKSEINNITWPSGKVVAFYSGAVLVVTAVLALYIYGLDSLFIRLLEYIVS